mgnify:CR=1 FL=1
MQFQANLIRAAAIVAAEKDIRSCLNGVRIEYKPGEDHVWIVGTDGGAMFVARQIVDRQTDPVELLIPTKEARKIKSKHAYHDGGDVVTWQIGNENHSLYSKAEPGLYPDWRRVVPDSVDNTRTNIRMDYMVKAQKVVTELCGKTSGDYVDIRGGSIDDRTPAIVMGLSSNCLMLIMPYRANSSVTEADLTSLRAKLGI